MASLERLSMDMQEQIRKLYDRNYSLRRIAKCLHKSRKTVKKYIDKFDRENVNEAKNTPVVASLDPNLPEWAQDIDWPEAIRERAKGVSYKTLQMELAPSVKYWGFWKLLSKMETAKPKTTLFLNHKPGERTHIDYADGIDIVCPTTGVVSKTQLFVGVLPFSQKVFAEFTASQKLPSFIESHERMWTFFGGVTPYTTPDNLKSAVTRAHVYDPDLNKNFCSYANHAGFAVLPARPFKPRDKASVEGSIGILQRTFFEFVRKKTFASLAELNSYLKPFLSDFNAQIMKDYGVSRNDRFEHESQLLLPLPIEKFEMSDWKISIVHPDCHIQVSNGLYSVPWTYVGKKVRVRLTSRIVEIFDSESAALLCTHTKSHRLGQRKTNNSHWPPEKKAHLSFDMESAKAQSLQVGPITGNMVAGLFEQPFPLRYLRLVQGILRLVNSSKFTKSDLEYASRSAQNHSNYKLKYLTDCCQFHARGGARPRAVGDESLLPKRQLSTIHLKTKIEQENQI
jgi:transposase